jgi:hypothetical protein
VEGGHSRERWYGQRLAISSARKRTHHKSTHQPLASADGREAGESQGWRRDAKNTGTESRAVFSRGCLCYGGATPVDHRRSHCRAHKNTSYECCVLLIPQCGLPIREHFAPMVDFLRHKLQDDKGGHQRWGQQPSSPGDFVFWSRENKNCPAVDFPHVPDTLSACPM